MKSLTSILTLSIIVAFSYATPSFVTRLEPPMEMNQYSMLNHTQHQINETELVRDSCTYKINIKTSCSSPANSNDVVDIIIGLGDVDGNQILSSPAPNTWVSSFKQCTMIPFEVHGDCIGKICNMFFVRFGTNGWMPESATLYYGDYPPVTFNFNYFIPWGVPSGINNC